MNFIHGPLSRARALIHHLRGPDAEALDARRASAFVAVSTLFVALLASLGGEWISFATHYYGLNHSIEFSTQPPDSVPVNQTFTTAVRLVKGNGQTDTANSTTTITLTLSGGPTAAVLTCDGTGTGGRMRTVNAGVATFNCSVDTVSPSLADPYRLIATASDSMAADQSYNGQTATSEDFFVTSGSGGGGGGGGGGAAQPAPAPGPIAPPPPPPPGDGPNAATGVVTPAGGDLPVNGGATADGGVTVSVPAGAFGENTRINVKVDNTSAGTPPSGSVNINVTVDINVAAPGATAGAERHELFQAPMEPIKVRLNLTAAQLGTNPIDRVRAGRVDDKTGEITPAPTTVINAGEGVVEFTAYGLSKFTLFAIVRPGPTLTAPPHESTSTNLGPLLRWTNPAGTVNWFEVRITPFNQDGPGIDLIIGDPAMVSAQQYQIKQPDFGGADPSYVMLPGMSYTWRVRTAGTTTMPTDADWSAWGDTIAFRTPPRGSTGISAVSPAAGATVSGRTPTVTWTNADKDIFYYEVQISSSSTFATTSGSPAIWWELVHGALSTPPNSYTVPSAFSLSAGTTYHWRVRPRVQGDGDPAAWSTASSFKTP